MSAPVIVPADIARRVREELEAAIRHLRFLERTDVVERSEDAQQEALRAILAAEAILKYHGGR